MVLQTELGDWQRFDSAPSIMAYVGLIPREHSTGERERKGFITKAGNDHRRHVLVQTAWSYHHPPKISAALKARRRGQPARVVSQAWKAQHHLHQLYRQLAFRKQPQVAAVAVARELTGFLWAVMRHYQPAPLGWTDDPTESENGCPEARLGRTLEGR